MSQPFAESKDGEKDMPKDLLENRVDGLYVCLISLHGLVRGDKMELGKDPDTGGQVSFPIILHSPHSVKCCTSARVSSKSQTSKLPLLARLSQLNISLSKYK